jgi:hypothetical protein
MCGLVSKFKVKVTKLKEFYTFAHAASIDELAYILYLVDI